MGLLTLYYASQAQLKVLDPDLVTQYPATVTGTPTQTANPGGPVTNFDPVYDADNTYLASVGAGVLGNTLDITNLDVENPNVNGGPLNDITTQYPATVTGTPTYTANPGGTPRNFAQAYTPGNPYLNDNPIQGQDSGLLYNQDPNGDNSLAITNLDVENPGVNGGPLRDTTTQYPATVTGTPSFSNYPAGPPKNFSQPNTPGNTYLNNVGTGVLENTLNITSLDVENKAPQGGPKSDSTTQYPPTTTGTPTTVANPGGPVRRFNPPYKPTFTYLNQINTGSLESTLAITNLDVENPGVNGGPLRDITTQYPALNTGTPTPTANPGGPATRFAQPYGPVNTYLNNNPIQGVGSGKLDNTLNITNLDVENPGVNGGPKPDTTTVYPITSTGTPTPIANPGGAPKRFVQPYKPGSGNAYLDANPIQGIHSVLYDSPYITNLDVEDPGVLGGPLNDTTTVYPASTTGTPTFTANPGSAAKQFVQPYSPYITYLDTSYNISPNNTVLSSSLNITNLDVENKGALGGPRSDGTTVYPITSTGTPTTIANPGGPAKRFNPPYKPTFTYLNNLPGLGAGILENTLAITNLDVDNPGVNGGIPYKTSNDPTIYPPTTNHVALTRGNSAVRSAKFNQVFYATNTYSDFMKPYKPDEAA